MKKILAILCSVVVLFTFVACSNGKCDSCGKEGKVKKYTFQGESANLCEDCGAAFDALKDLAE